MAGIQCLKKSCNREVQYVCHCLSPDIHLCEKHFEKHLKLPNMNHSFESLYIEPYEATKDAILRLLAKEKLKKGEAKKKLLESYSQLLKSSVNILNESLRKIDSESWTICCWIERISQAKKISKLEQDPILKLLALQPETAAKSIKEMVSVDFKQNICINLLCKLSDEIERIIECLIKDEIKNFLEKRTFSIKNIWKDHEKAISNFQEIDDFISQKKAKTEKYIMKLEELKWKNSVQIQDLNTSLNYHLNFTEKPQDIENDKSLSQFEQNTENQLLSHHQFLAKRNSLLSSPNNPQKEKDFRLTYLSNLKNFNPNSEFNEDFQEYIKSYNKLTSIYLFRYDSDEDSDSPSISYWAEKSKESLEGCPVKFYVFNTESEKEVVKALQVPGEYEWNLSCIVQLPNDELLFFKGEWCTTVMIIDNNYIVRKVSCEIPWAISLPVYFNKSVYCDAWSRENHMLLSIRFDLESNQWIKLAPMPDHYIFQRLIYKRNILSPTRDKNILIYSIDIDSYSEIYYDFLKDTAKILINSPQQRLYLIEFNCGSIYESDIDDEYSWQYISKSTIDEWQPIDVYWTYNKEAVYIGFRSDCVIRKYFKFDLDQKKLISIK